MSFVVMCGGANSTLTQQWGAPFGTGAVLLTVLVVATVIFGLEGIIKALGKIGPTIIVMILLVSSITAVTGWSAFADNLIKVDQGVYADVMKQVGGGQYFRIRSIIRWIRYFVVCRFSIGNRS